MIAEPGTLYLSPEALMTKLDALIEQHYLEKRSADFYSSELAYETRTLNEIAKAERGSTVFMQVQYRLYKEATALLEDTRMPIKTITYTLDFEDPAYFCRFFKKISGMPPSEYRKAARIKAKESSL